MSDVLAFWAVCLAVGALGMPITFALLRRLPDAGAGMSFALGLALAGYGYFILRVFDVLPPGRGGYLLALALLGLVSSAVAGRDRRFASTLRRSWPAWLSAIGVFTAFFFLAVSFRSYNAEIGGTEQPMDLMYLNATLTSPDYPPHDPWLAGEPASYYYFGHLQAGLLTAAAGVPASTGYNLSLASTFGAAAAGVASLAFALARWALGTRGRRWAMGAATLAIVLLLFVGSLSAIFEWTAAHGRYDRGLYEAFGVEWLIPCEDGATEDCYRGPVETRTSAWYPTEFWFWWRGSRIIPDTITEFPFFSFLLGDLHPHVTSIPLVLLATGISAAFWRGRRILRFATHRARPFEGLALAVIFGALAFQNAWDALTFSAVLALAVIARNLRGGASRQRLVDSAGYLLPLWVISAVAFIPWYVDFSSQAGGLYPYVREGTRPAHAFLQFGPLMAAALLSLVWSFRRAPRSAVGDALWSTAWLPLLPFLGWMALAAYHGDFRAGLQARGSGGWVTLVAYGLTAWALVAASLVLARRRGAAAFGVAILAVAAMLLLGSELFLIKDVFFGSVPRLNTVFKLTYQAWILLSAGGAVALVVALRGAWERRNAAGWFAMPAGALVAAGLVYPLLASMNRTEGFRKETAIDGLSALARNNPAEYALTRWMQDNTGPGDVIIEASGRAWRRDANGAPVLTDAGNDYSDAGRVSARTGRQAPLGWYFHEIQWRGETPANRGRFTRLQDIVDRAYLGTPEEVLNSMRETGARYLVVGGSGPGGTSFERAKYGPILPDYASFLDVVFEDGDARVYALPEYREVHTS
ncbi:MAG: hypothetical protein C0506_10285 [Anaerolinea sp.]|nr:hypothetical protein [Anaerolinea sp.]